MNLLIEGRKPVGDNDLNLKEYLNIQEDKFTISNDVLYIFHNKGNELVLNLITKERWDNPIIPSIDTPLSPIFNIQLNTDHKFNINHNDIDIYTEEVTEKYEPNYFHLAFTIGNHGEVTTKTPDKKYQLHFKSRPTIGWNVELPSRRYANQFTKNQAYDNEYTIKLNRETLKPYGTAQKHLKFAFPQYMEVHNHQPLQYEPRHLIRMIDHDNIFSNYIGRPNTPETRNNISQEITETAQSYLRSLSDRFAQPPIIICDSDTDDETPATESKPSGKWYSEMTINRNNTDGINYSVDWDDTKPVATKPATGKSDILRILKEYLGTTEREPITLHHELPRSDRSLALSMALRANLQHRNNNPEFIP